MQNIMTKDEYRKYSEKMSPKSNTLRNITRAFLVGGVICSIGQFFTNVYKSRGFGQAETASLTSMTMIFIAILLTALNVYDEIGKFGGAGSTVPITGFANSIVSPAMEFKTEGYVMGLGAKMFIVAGPVLVYGISASIVAGIIYYLLHT
ncbi:MAG TPA: stage V sporulation protein AC [Clostridiaceae bacterium]|nr:stage V sporulation protein AC [Clostridiaceae bacterium]